MYTMVNIFRRGKSRTRACAVSSNNLAGTYISWIRMVVCGNTRNRRVTGECDGRPAVGTVEGFLHIEVSASHETIQSSRNHAAIKDKTWINNNNRGHIRSPPMCRSFVRIFWRFFNGLRASSCKVCATLQLSTHPLPGKKSFFVAWKIKNQ